MTILVKYIARIDSYLFSIQVGNNGPIKMPRNSPNNSWLCGLTGPDMNSYVPNNIWRVVSVLLLASIMLTGALNLVLNTADFEFQWAVNPSSTAGIFGLLYYLFDRFIWKWELLRRFDIVTIPDLNGVWRGEIKSSYNQGKTIQVSVIIKQRWSKILVELKANESHSKSVAASFLTDYSTSPELVYAYVNEPKPSAQESMEMHKGTTRLTFTGQALEGDYYTGRGRGTTGSIRLTRE